MALYMKQDFSPTVLTPRWFAMKFRPNMLLNRGEYIISILESGLLFREDCLEIEQECPAAEALVAAAGFGRGKWLTKGEALLSGAAVALCIYISPPKTLSRTTLIQTATYISIPLAVRLAHRSMFHAPLQRLISNMQTYLSTARRAAAILKELSTFCTQIDTLTSILESTHTLLCRQQSDLSVLMSRASSALLGNAPWIRDDVAWEAHNIDRIDNLQQIHHAFMVVQSSLLKHIAMAHFIPSPLLQKVYKNHNERIYWLHNVLIRHLNEEFQIKLEALQRMYRVLKHSTNRTQEPEKIKSSNTKNMWIYSEIQTGVARAALELKIALDKSNSLDILLDSCAINNQTIDIDTLDKDIDNIIDIITKSLNSVQNSQLRLKSLKNKMNVKKEVEPETKEVTEEVQILNLEPQTPKDEVFYFVKSEDDSNIQSASDLVTGPGNKEKETTKIVLNELKRKLGKREDIMRERERQALVKTMPQLQNVPEFPRQIQFDEFVVKKGYISKIRKNKTKKRFANYLISKRKRKSKKYVLKKSDYVKLEDLSDIYEANALLNVKSKIVTFSSENGAVNVIRWRKRQTVKRQDLNIERVVKDDDKVKKMELKFNRKDLELTESSDSDYENHRALLQDVHKYRVRNRQRSRAVNRQDVNRIENIQGPNHRQNDVFLNGDDNLHRPSAEDEGLRPMEYSLGAGLAMAAVMQRNNHRVLAQEEVFIGDGEVSNDSGNEESN